MFTNRVKLFNLLGFPIYVDATWLILAVLITWSLAQGLFPNYFPDLPPVTYWLMGAAGALGLFVSIVLHELGHSIVARSYGISIRGITLFLFGGVAEMEEEPRNARSEFFMAIAGPIMSLVLAVLFFVGQIVLMTLNGNTPVSGVIGYLALLNVILAVFNMVPAFPLDGGRVLRATLWAIRDDLRWATRISSGIGTFFGTGLIVLGVFAFIGGDFVGGLWWCLIGMFMRGASQMSYRQLLMRRALEGEPLAKFMHSTPVAVDSQTTIAELVENYIYRQHYKMFPVVDDGRLVGCVTTREVKDVPREEWETKRVSDILQPCGKDNTVSAREDAMRTLMRMNQTGNSRFLVTEGDRLVGVVTLKDLLKFLSLKMDLEGDGDHVEHVI
jgi:Zn-dependent protease/sulfur carrier protein ThiS